MAAPVQVGPRSPDRRCAAQHPAPPEIPLVHDGASHVHVALHDRVMSKSIQVAFTLDRDDLTEVEELVPEVYESRAAALRDAVRQMLERRRQSAIDAALERGYADVPSQVEERVWAEASMEGLASADLDW